MRIRRAKLKDAEEISKLRINNIKKIVSKEYGKKWTGRLIEWNSVEHIKNHIRDRDVFCMTEKNEILGTVDLNGNKVGGLYVKLNWIGKGIGKQLLAFIEGYARKEGLTKVYLYSTKNAFNFYKKLGYKLKEKRRVKVGRISNIDLIMEKKLI